MAQNSTPRESQWLEQHLDSICPLAIANANLLVSTQAPTLAIKRGLVRLE